MHQQTTTQIVEELERELVGRFLGKIFQLTPFSFAIDFGLRQGRYLYLNLEPQRPRVYLIERQTRQLAKESISLSQFALAMRSSLNGASIISVNQDEWERIVRISFLVQDETGESHNSVIVAQLTGRSANLFLLDVEGCVIRALRFTKGEGQQPGDRYQPPPPQTSPNTAEKQLDLGDFPSISAAADDYYKRLEAEELFAVRAKTVHDRLRKEINKRLKLKENLNRDLANHGDAEQHKRIGDLLLANLANAQRRGDKVDILDYYSEGQPEIEIEIDRNISLQEAAGRYFARYTKAKRAAEKITAKLAQLERELAELQSQQLELAKKVAACDPAGLAKLEPAGKEAVSNDNKQRLEKIAGVRRYRSSDGYEVIVGRAAHRNDYLTFRVARPNDLWLHTADYPGSHVIVRRLNRAEIPHRTIVEAAQIAAKFSQARKDSKVVVHYTHRKFLSKPKGAAPGLVRMSTFKTIMVEPKEAIERI